MQWIAPPEKDAASTTLEERLWDLATMSAPQTGRDVTQYRFAELLQVASASPGAL